MLLFSTGSSLYSSKWTGGALAASWEQVINYRVVFREGKSAASLSRRRRGRQLLNGSSSRLSIYSLNFRSQEVGPTSYFRKGRKASSLAQPWLCPRESFKGRTFTVEPRRWYF